MPTAQPSSSGLTSQAKQARSRKAGIPAEQSTTVGRAGSAGGVVLEASKNKPSTPAVVPKAATATTPQPADTTTGPNRQRRKPRKLNKEPTPTQSTPAPASATAEPPSAAAIELEALKSRVRGLEAKVEDLYTSTEARTGRSPRRRGKGRKDSSNVQVPTLSSIASATRPEDGEEDEEADEELVRLEDELEDARKDLEVYQPRTRPRTKRAPSSNSNTEDIEEIPRDGRETVTTTGDRQVTLSGSYRIPLPSNLDMKDVQKIQSGVSAAQNVAKSFLDQRRAAQSARAPTTPPVTSAGKPRAAASVTAGGRKPSNPATDMEAGDNGKSWGEWFGGYSMAISRAVKTIEAEAAIENQKAAPKSIGSKPTPPPANRTVSASTSKKNAVGGAKGAQRPGMKGKQNLSSEQVQGLMS
jgi:hypothetical protein